jgi:hypothetical protein
MTDNLEKYVTSPIDTEPAALSEELAHGAATLYQASMKVASALQDYQIKKLALKRAEASVDQRFRREAAESNTRLTEGAIASATALSPEVQEAYDALNQASYTLDQAKALYEAVRERLWDIHKLVEMNKQEMMLT